MSDKTISHEVFQASFAALGEEYDAFMTFWRVTLSSPQSAAALIDALETRRFDLEQIRDGKVGCRKQEGDAAVIYGNLATMDTRTGALHTYYGPATTNFPYAFRFCNRWDGTDNVLQLGEDNRITVEWNMPDQGVARPTLLPHMLNGRVIANIDETGVHVTSDSSATEQGAVVVAHDELWKVVEGMRDALRITREVMDEQMSKLP